jgi:hypothetical protein
MLRQAARPLARAARPVQVRYGSTPHYHQPSGYVFSEEVRPSLHSRRAARHHDDGREACGEERRRRAGLRKSGRRSGARGIGGIGWGARGTATAPTAHSLRSARKPARAVSVSVRVAAASAAPGATPISTRHPSRQSPRAHSTARHLSTLTHLAASPHRLPRSPLWGV